MPEYRQFNVIIDMHGSKHEFYSLYGKKDNIDSSWEKISNTYFGSHERSSTKEEFCELEILARAIVENKVSRGNNPNGSAVVFSRLEENGSTEITIGDGEFVPGIARYRRILEKEEIKKLIEFINEEETKIRAQ